MTEPAALLEARITELLPRLRRFARALTRNPHDADDVLQCALERAITHFGQWQTNTRLDSWLYTIVKNTWIDELRSRNRSQVLARDADHVELKVDREADQSTTLSIEQAIERLPAEQRLAVMLVLVGGLSYKEAAQIMNVPIGTLTSRLARGRTALQSWLRPEE